MVLIVWYRKASVKKMDGRGRVFKGLCFIVQLNFLL